MKNNHNAGSMVEIENLFSEFQYVLSQSKDKNVEAFTDRLQQLVQGNNVLWTSHSLLDTK